MCVASYKCLCITMVLPPTLWTECVCICVNICSTYVSICTKLHIYILKYMDPTFIMVLLVIFFIFLDF